MKSGVGGHFYAAVLKREAPWLMGVVGAVVMAGAELAFLAVFFVGTVWSSGAPICVTPVVGGEASMALLSLCV